MIYIACPEKFATGGTELLHQLYFKLKKNKKNVRMYYYNFSGGDPVASRFKKYEIEYVNKIEDLDSNLLIIPEVTTELLSKFKKIKKAIWWLSVDNYFISMKDSSIFWKKILKKILRKTKKSFNFNDKVTKHYVQSEYARQFLVEKEVSNIEYLSDYLNDIFLKERINYSEIDRENIVLYNPKKGMEFTKEIMDKFKNIKFIPLENMTPEEVMQLCKRSKVYIDFGNHPGKDRFPREAAILGCCIITGKRGSAKFYEDVMILDNYKFNDSKENILEIGNKIIEIFENYDSKIKDFEIYRNMIKNEEKKFEDDVIRIFDSMENRNE